MWLFKMIEVPAGPMYCEFIYIVIFYKFLQFPKVFKNLKIFKNKAYCCEGSPPEFLLESDINRTLIYFFSSVGFCRGRFLITLKIENFLWMLISMLQFYEPLQKSSSLCLCYKNKPIFSADIERHCTVGIHNQQNGVISYQTWFALFSNLF